MTEELQVATQQETLDQYRFTTKTNKELIFDESTGRFFETSIRPGRPLCGQEDEENSKTDEPVEMTTTSDMVPTEILFGTASSSSFESSSPLMEEKGAQEFRVHSGGSNPRNEPENHDDDEQFNSTPRTIVDKCYKAWNQRDMKAAAECFSSSTNYRDYQYLGSMANRQQLQEHFSQQANLLPPNCQIVVDHLAYDTKANKIATHWHVERPDGTNVQFTKGCSFYTLDSSGLIQSGYRANEMVIKPNRDAVNALLALVPSSPGSSSDNKMGDSLGNSEPSSVVEQYFDAWNRRDMEAALECLTPDCVYQTEDPVFVGTLNGKKEMREHLQQNANVLPTAAKIVLDDVAVDRLGRGTIGTRWHLEVNGVTLPSLNGCSMYTTDPNTGKIKTALDITEAPVKLPREALSLSRAPPLSIFHWN